MTQLDLSVPTPRPRPAPTAPPRHDPRALRWRQQLVAYVREEALSGIAHELPLDDMFGALAENLQALAATVPRVAEASRWKNLLWAMNRDVERMADARAREEGYPGISHVRDPFAVLALVEDAISAAGRAH